MNEDALAQRLESGGILKTAGGRVHLKPVGGILAGEFQANSANAIPAKAMT